MNSQELQHEIDLRNGQIDQKRISLKKTDYIDNKITEALVLYGMEKAQEVTEQYRGQLSMRQVWRDDINTLQEEVTLLEAQKAAAEEQESQVNNSMEG